MRILGVILSASLGVAVIAQGAYIIKTRKQVDALSEQVRELSAQAEEVGGPTWSPSASAPARSGAVAHEGGAARTPPPRFVVPAPNAQAAPLPAALDHPETREQLRQFVAATLQSEREQERDRQRQRREDEERERTTGMAKGLGLNDEETRKFTDLVANMQTQRQAMRQKIESGELTREQIGAEFQALRQKNQTEMQQLLGDERMKKYEEMRGAGRNRGPRGEGGVERGGPPGPPPG